MGRNLTDRIVIARQLSVMAILVALAACAGPAQNVERTWDKAVVSITGFGAFVGLDNAYLGKHLAKFPPGKKFPTMIYMHGGGGVSSRTAMGDIDTARIAGLIVIAPDSFARNRSKNPDIDPNVACYRCGDEMALIGQLRRAELAYAVEQVRKLPWVDQDNLFGWGHSEGTFGMAPYSGNVFKARVITGHGCRDGLGAKEPTLAIISAKDPFAKKWRSSCERFVSSKKNLTYLEIPGTEHNAAQTEEGKRAFLQFIRRHITPPQ